MMIRRLILATLLSLTTPALAASDDCDMGCLDAHADAYLDALVAKDTSSLPLAKDVHFSENLIPLTIGEEGLWRTITAKRDWDIYASDEELGHANWIGIVDEMGNAVFLAIRLKIENGEITEAETLVGRSPLTAADHAPPARDFFSEIEPAETRSSRDRLMEIVHQHWDAMETGKAIRSNYRDDCVRYDNGHLTTGTKKSPAEGGPPSTNIGEFGCYGQMASGRFVNGNTVYPRRFWGVDEERGLVIGYFSPNVPGDATSVEVYGQTVEMGPGELVPFTIQQVELFKVVDGQVKGVEVVFGPRVPFGMRSPFDMKDLWRQK